MTPRRCHFWIGLFALSLLSGCIAAVKMYWMGG